MLTHCVSSDHTPDYRRKSIERKGRKDELVRKKVIGREKGIKREKESQRERE